jgi:hypothetical protein
MQFQSLRAFCNRPERNAARISINSHKSPGSFAKLAWPYSWRIGAFLKRAILVKLPYQGILPRLQRDHMPPNTLKSLTSGNPKGGLALGVAKTGSAAAAPRMGAANLI